MALPLTDHARKRLQQRGIQPRDVEAVMHFGTVSFDHRGARIFYFDKQSRRRLVSAQGHDAERRRETLGGVYVVVGNDGAIVTVGHRVRPIQVDRTPRRRRVRPR